VSGSPNHQNQQRKKQRIATQSPKRRSENYYKTTSAAGVDEPTTSPLPTIGSLTLERYSRKEDRLRFRKKTFAQRAGEDH